MTAFFFFKFNRWIMRVNKKISVFALKSLQLFFSCILYCKVLVTHILQFIWCLIFQNISMQIAIIPWDGGCWFEHSYLPIHGFVCLECPEVRWKVGALKYIYSSISYPFGGCLLFLVRVQLCISVFHLIEFYHLRIDTSYSVSELT